jgi:hypothetical protein
MAKFTITENRKRTEVYSVIHEVEAKTKEEAEQMFLDDSPKIITTEDETNHNYTDDDMTGYSVEKGV